MRFTRTGIAAPEGRSQRGLTVIELAVAGTFSLLVVGLAGAFLISNLRAYSEIKRTLAMQNNLKRSLHAMTRQISNAGGWMPDPRGHFKAESGRITFAYYDVEARYCDTPDTLVASFFASNRGFLIEEHRCGKGPRKTRTLAEPPLGGSLSLRFTYLDANGSLTHDPKKIKAVRLDLDQQLARRGARTSIGRGQTIQVEMVNL